jgi:hypothetical protein
MYRTIQLIFCTSLLILPGCVNRPAGLFGSNARVPAPGTYQLKIPSLANQPYYSPNQGSSLAVNPDSAFSGINPPNFPVNPSAAAPTVVANRDLQGWKLIDGQTAPQSMAPVYQSPNTIAANDSWARPNFQVASGTTLTRGAGVNPGTSLVGQSNPRLADSTRMAAIDASSIRPPAAVTPSQQQYFGSLHSSGNPSIAAQNPASNLNGLTQPQLPNRYAAQPVVGRPGSYQSPYIRGAVMGQGMDASPGATGWVARDDVKANR